jgi:predicted PurR-regulated permease PerM
MNTTINPKERFRKGFVLVMTLAYVIVFLAIIDGFIEALLLAAVFSGIVYPVYCWLQRKLGGRNTMASLMTLVISLVAILVPLTVPARPRRRTGHRRWPTRSSQ